MDAWNSLITDSSVVFYIVPLAPVERPSFKVGMKLEAVDQRFPYCVCGPLSWTKVVGRRVTL